MCQSREIFPPSGNMSLESSNMIYMFLQCLITSSLKLWKSGGGGLILLMHEIEEHRKQWPKL